MLGGARSWLVPAGRHDPFEISPSASAARVCGIERSLRARRNSAFADSPDSRQSLPRRTAGVRAPFDAQTPRPSHAETSLARTAASRVAVR